MPKIITKTKRILDFLITLQSWVIVALAIINLVVLSLNMYFDSPRENAFASFNSSLNRYEDVITSPHQYAVFEYLYNNPYSQSENASFEMNLINQSGDTPINLLDIVEINDIYPVNSSGNIIGGASTRDQRTGVYNSANSINIRFTPRSTCTPYSQGGCTPKPLVPSQSGEFGKITIKVSLKVNASNIPTRITGSGSLNFSNQGLASNSSKGWFIQANHQTTNGVLNPNVVPNVSFTGENGQGQVFNNQKYAIVVNGLKGTNGDVLNAPNGYCKTSRNGTDFVTNGISNGRCVINVNQSASTFNAGGVLFVSDGGNPRSITQQFNYSSGSGNSDPSNYTSFISSIGFSGDKSVYEVSFSTRNFNNGNNGFHLGFYYNTENQSSSKSFSGGSPYKIGVNSKPSNATELCLVVLRPDNSVITNSGQCSGLPSSNIPITNKFELTPGDVQPIKFVCLNSLQNSVTTCKFTLPPDRTLPANFSIGIGNAVGTSKCKPLGSQYLCENVKVGFGSGKVGINAFFGNQAYPTGETMIISSGGSGFDPKNNGNGTTDGFVDGVEKSDDKIEKDLITEEFVTTVTINKKGNNFTQTKNNGSNTSVEDNTKTNNGSGTTSSENKPIIPAKNETKDLVSTGGMAFFVISSLSSIIILSIFSINISRGGIKFSSKNK
jgi:hypothetical protein